MARELGMFNREGARRIVDAVRKVEAMPQYLLRAQPNKRRHDPGRTAKKYAKVTAATAFGSTDAQWYYTITQVDLTVTVSAGAVTAVNIADKDGGINDGLAINLAELNNEGSSGVAFGVDRAGADYPTGFDPRPLGGGGTDNTHQYDTVVEIVGQIKASDGETIVYLIDRMGTHDGTCS